MITERVVRFGPEQALTGILSEPSAADSTPAFIMLNAGVLHRVGPSRLHVTLGRALSSRGIAALRFDLAGFGDSQPRATPIGFGEAAVQDVAAAIDALGSRGASRVVLFGICSGADFAVRAALADPRIVGLVMIDGYAYRTRRYHVTKYLKAARRPLAWARLFGRGVQRVARVASSGDDSAEVRVPSTFVAPFPPRDEVEQRLRELADRGVRQLHIYTGGYGWLYNHRGQFRAMFRSLRGRPEIDAEFWPEAGHTFPQPVNQQRLIRRISEWLDAGTPVSSPNRQSDG